MAERNSAIVYFDTDNSVEVVPKQWINDDETSSYFPDNIKGKKLSKTVKNSINAEPSWPKHLCTVMRYYETYDDAKMYLNDAMYTSDLSAFEKGRSRQKKKQNKSTVLPVHPSNSSYNVQPLTISMGSQEEPGPSFVQLSDSPRQDDGSHSVILPVHSPVVATCDCDGRVNTFSIGWILSISKSFVILKYFLYYVEFRRDVLLQLQALKDISQQQTELLNCILEQVRINPQRPTTISEPEVEYSFVPNQFPIKDLDSLDDLLQIITNNKKAYEELVRNIL
ncbi:unnamed protein product [Orchesella dallaii]|uniref:Uncharacterized protein n=1 Tax=Orchesella dallaii TaxID=48710 RepID=A0ABP1RL96_9HEXA